LTGSSGSFAAVAGATLSVNGTAILEILIGQLGQFCARILVSVVR
jgi:hypothetical protein